MAGLYVLSTIKEKRINPGAIRATLRDPDGFGHIGWMIRLSGVFGAAARFPPPGFFHLWGSGE